MIGILENFKSIEELAQEFDVCTRTIVRYEEKGLLPPAVVLGRRRLYLIEAIKEALEKRVCRRRGGRTTKARYGADHYSRIGKMGGRPPMKQAKEIEK